MKSLSHTKLPFALGCYSSHEFQCLVMHQHLLLNEAKQVHTDSLQCSCCAWGGWGQQFSSLGCYCFLWVPAPSWVPQDRITKQQNDAHSALEKQAGWCCNRGNLAIHSLVLCAKKNLKLKNKGENISGVLSGINVVAEIRPLPSKYWE